MTKPHPNGLPQGKWAGLAVIGGHTALAASAGAMASADAPDFYTDLLKPAWAPPPTVFGPVWSVLYVLMAVAAWLVWRKRGLTAVKVPLVLYLIQLILNALWTWLFFRWRLVGWAVIEIIVLWLVLVITVLCFRRVSNVAATLLIPYLVWVSFAAVLAAEILRLNQSLI